jgi:hypothetical protein
MSKTADLKRLLTTPGAADYCGSTESTFEKYRITGVGPEYIKIGRKVVYETEALDRWLAERRRRSTSETRLCPAPSAIDVSNISSSAASQSPMPRPVTLRRDADVPMTIAQSRSRR